MAKFCLRAIAIVAASAIALSAVEVSSFQHAVTVTVGMKLPAAQRLNHFSQQQQQQHHSNKAASTARVLQVSRRQSASASKVLLKAAEVGISETPKDKVVPFPIVLWRFTRPHTLIGSALAIPALHILAAPTYKDAFTTATAISTLFAMIPSLLMNLYITGLNQITDVEIDKINKPKLPIAAGDLSPKTANLIVTVALILSLAMGMAHPILGSRGLNVALWGSGILGTMYSLEPVRLKRFPLFAAFCIVAVRGAVINAGFYAHATSAAYGVPTSVLACLRNDMRCLLSSSFFAVFGIVIALMKDVPDAIGDAKFNIRSFTVRIGQKTVFTSMRRLLTALFFGVGAGFTRFAVQAFASAAAASTSAAASTCTLGIGRSIVAISAFAAGISVRQEAQSVNAEDSGEVYNYYMHLWKLFYASYLVLPFAR